MQSFTGDNGQEKKRGQKTVAYGIAAAVFFVLFAFADGPFFEADSESYLTMNIFREPGYPLFLAFCRLLPGASSASFSGYAGVWYAVIIQSIVWAYATWRFAHLIMETVRNGGAAEKTVQIAGWAAMALQFAVCLLNRFASGRGAMYSNSILTESLAMPLYILFVCYLFYLIRDGGKKNLLRCAICALLLITIRKHMTITLLLWGFAVFVIRLVIGKTRQVRTFAIHCAVILLVFLGSRLFTGCYNLVRFGSFAQQAGRSEGMLCMLLYTAEESDAELFRENEAAERAWFEEMARKQRESGARYADAPHADGWMARYEYFMNRYDEIGYGIVHGVLLEAAEEKLGADASVSSKTREMYELEGTLLPGLLRQELRDYVQVYADNLLAGLLYSNARASVSYLPVSFLFYGFYLGMLIRCVRSRQQADGVEDGDAITGRDIPLLAFLVLSGLLINAGTVAAFIFSQPRYNIYSMAMFYAMMVVMRIPETAGSKSSKGSKKF